MKKLLLALFQLFFTIVGFGQAPSISYSGPQVYIVGKPISNLAPAKTGGAVPATVYGQVTNFAGTGARGAVNGNGASATFYQPNGLAKDSKGNIYVADYANNLIRKITPGGLVSTFVPASAGLLSPAGVAMDATDNLYIADAGNNQIKKVSPAGVVSLFAGSGSFGFAGGPALSSSFKYPSGVAVDASGNVYVADFGNQEIRKIASGIVTVLAGTGASGFVNGSNAVARFNGPFGIATDAAGNIYVAENSNNAIRMITPAGNVSTLAGSGTAGSADGTGSAASFARPSGVTVDATGNVYVSDSDNSLIRVISPAGVVTTVAGTTGTFGNINGTGTDAVFSFPVGITADGSGNLYVADNGTNIIRKIIVTGYSITPLLPSGLNFDGSTGIISGTPTVVSPSQNYTISAYNNAGSGATIVNIATRPIGSDATLSSLTTSGVTLSPAFSPGQYNYVMTVPQTTTTVTITPSVADANASLTVNGTPMVSGTAVVMPVNPGGNTTTIRVTAEDGITIATYLVSVIRPRPAVAAPVIAYSTPQQYTVNVAIPPLAPKSTGGAVPANAYGAVATFKSGLADATAVAVDPAGNVYTTDIVNNQLQKITPGGIASTVVTGLYNPFGLGADAFGNIYIGDSNNNMIKKLSSAGQVSIVSGASGDFDLANGDAQTAAKFRFPIGVATDGSGNIYVGDQSNYDIREISAAGQVTTFAGTDAIGSANGTGSSASFNEPFGVATDINNNVYVADSKNNLIRKITPGGVTTTLAGSGTAGQTNATGIAASFDTPLGVATDVLGNVYVADAANSVIRKITPGGVVTSLAGSGYYTFADGIGRLAGFSYPTGIAADQDGQLFVADNNNKAVRTVQTTGYAITPLALPAGLVFDATTGTVTGTPTAVTAAKNYTITAYNLGGSSTAIVNIKVNAANNDATLKSLVLSAGTLTPAFNSATLTYTTNNTGNASAITLTPASTQGSATITVNGSPVVSGTASANLPLAVGPNSFTIKVTATDGVTTKNYVLTVNRPAPVYATDATLSALTLSTGALTPGFNINTTSYNATVAGTVTGLTVTPVRSESHATISVKGVVVASGTASGAIPLNYGANTVDATVTAEDGTTIKTYSITVVRQVSANADLNDILLSTGTLSPTFSSAGLSYTAQVANTTGNITLTPYTADATATVLVNGAMVNSGSPSVVIPLVTGANFITVKVTAQDGTTTKTYQVTVTRAASPNADLSALTLSSGTLSPAFNAATTNYNSTVANALNSITITPLSAGVNEIITVNGTAVASGTTSGAIPLGIGNNMITINVVAEDGINQKNYFVTVTRLPSADAGLAGLTLNSGFLTPAFNPGTTVYSAGVGNTTTKVQLTPTVSEPNATVTINGVPVNSGTASADILLNVGANNISTVVTAQDGVTKNTYVLTVNRAASANADLAGLAISSGMLAPAFTPATISYTTSVSNSTTFVNLTPALSDATASIKINGVAVASGAVSGNIALNVGSNIINTVVTAQDGTTIKTYSIAVSRAPSTNAGLANLVLSSGGFSPAFMTGTTGYAASVPNSVASIQLTPTTSDATATVVVNGVPVTSGSASANIALNVGSNTISTVVTAQDGTTVLTYTITVTRAPSTNADLAALTPSVGVFTPVFSAGTTSYNSSVGNTIANITLTPTTVDNFATININGIPVANGTPSAAIPLNIGINTLTTVVTAQDGVSQKTYTLNVTRPKSPDATLANFTISDGLLSPAFSPGVFVYTASVTNPVAFITISPSVNEANATVIVNGTAVSSGSASGNIPLNIGMNTITTVVTAQDGTMQTYTLTVTRAASPDATLASLTLSAGTLAPVFSPANQVYNASVTNATTSITLTPLVNQANATVTINGNTVISGTASGNIPLNVGANVVTAVVTAQDGTLNNYSINVTRAASSNANLSGLITSAGVLTPVFSSSTLDYTITVANTDNTLSLTPVKSDPAASVTINGVAVVSGTPSQAIPLAVGGSNLINVLVTAEDGTTKKYTVTVTRQPSADADLAGLSLSSGTLNPVFAAATINYTATVVNANASIQLTPLTSDATATVTINGLNVVSGTASGSIALAVGQNVITTVVTAQDGSKKTYEVTVTRAPSADATLAGLGLSNGTLAPVFSPGVTFYTANVSNAVDLINITPVVNEANATVKVNGVTVASGSASAAIALNVGTNTITTTIIAQDGSTTQAYTVTVTRAPSADDNLSALTVSAGVLSPSFSQAATSYTVAVGNAITSITFSPTVNDANATVTVNGSLVAAGSASAVIPLNVGANLVTITVTAQDGTSTKTYTANVTRAPSADATLSDLTLSSGSLTPAFSSSVLTYTVSVGNAVNSVSVTPTVNENNATVKVNGTAVSSGAASGPIALLVGPNVINAVVTAQDGITTRSYSVTVMRAPSADATLTDLKLSNGTLSPSIASGSIYYNASVGNAVKSITFTPFVNEPNATVTINGTVVASGSASAAIPLIAGANTITTIVTAQDGVTSKTYIATITRAPSTDANLTDLAISSGNLSPSFNTVITGYALLVKNNVTKVTLTPLLEDNTATIVINGLAVTSGSASQPISLSVGNNKITTTVTAQDGSTKKIYVITVNRALSSDNDLSDLIPSNGTLAPVFESGITDYSASVSNAISNIKLTPFVADANASVKINGITVASGTTSSQINLAVGPNTIIAVVTAQNGETNTYTLVVTRAPGTDASLSNLTLNNGLLNPGFTTGNSIYTAAVSNSVTSINVTPTVNDATATIKVNGNTVASGSASSDIALNVGANTITTIVTAQDGSSTKTYTITVNRAKSPDATLASLLTSDGTLNPIFSPALTGYTLDVNNSTTVITVTPTKNEVNASIKVNGVSVASGIASQAVPLTVGSGNVITVSVTAEDGTIENYIIKVTRLPSGNADLADLVLSTGTLAPGFSSGITDYQATAPNNATSIKLTPTVSDATATVKVNNTAVVSGSASGNIQLTVGVNTITTTVTAANGSIKTYTLTVTRLQSNNASLANITINGGTLTPNFTQANLNYQTDVGNATTQLMVTPLVSDVNATVTVNGTAFTGASVNVPLQVGSNQVTILVTAQDGSTKTYTIVATREASANASLNNLALSSGTLTPGFATGNLLYKASVVNSVSGISITPTAMDANATIKVNSVTVTSGFASNPIALNVGDNIITTTVTAQDGISTKTYTVTVTRAKSSDATLAMLVTSSGVLSPLFNSAITGYTVDVDNSTTSITVTPTTNEANASIKVNGSTVSSGAESQLIPLVVGPGNLITVSVTAEDGTIKSYTVTVNRLKSADATLANLSSPAAALTPAFAPDVLSYDINVINTVTSATLIPTANDPAAIIQVNGSAVNSGSVSQSLPLLPGRNPFNVIVTAANGSTQTYVVTFVRQPSGDDNLTSLILSAGDIVPGFTEDNTLYQLHLPYSADRTKVTAITSDAGATIKINGTLVSSGSASGDIALSSGTNTITLIVTAANSNSKPYVVTVIRDAPPPSSNADLALLTISEGQLTPVFRSGTTSYAATVTSTTQNVRLTAIPKNAGATITINGATVLSGAASDNIALANGENQIFVVVTAADGVTTKTYTVTVTKATFAMILPNAFTPNGDGVNDFWILPNIQLYPDCTVKIFNRGGQQLFSSVGYGTPWDGTFNGHALPPDVYYYIIDLKHDQGVRSGAVTIMK